MPQLALPLFTKELTELAMRRRTYVVRVIYAVALLFLAWLAFKLMTIDRSNRAIDYLGTGAIVLWWVGYLQNVGMLIVLPALACDVFTREKERQTIGLLFLTRLSPLTIVFEKFLSRLFPALCLLWISLPMLAFSYSLGGVEAWQIVNAAVGLATNALTITAIAVVCSSVCQTTTSAFLWSYALILLTPLMVVSSRTGGDPVDFILFGKFLTRAIYLDPPQSMTATQATAWLNAGGLSTSMLYLKILGATLPSCVFALIYLAIARIFLVSRAFKKAGRSWRWLYVPRQRQSTFLYEVAQARGHEAFVDDVQLPDQAPVAWRERRNRWLPRIAYRIALGILLGVIALIIVSFVGDQSHILHRKTSFTVMCISLWIGMTLLLITRTAGLITQERSQQTLFVLLTTPLRSVDIIKQKLSGIQSLVWMCLIPLAIFLVARMIVATPEVHRQSGAGQIQQVAYPMAFLNEITMFVIYPQITIWGALYFSLRSRTTIAAIMKSILSIVFLCIFPWIILILFAIAFGGLSETYFPHIIALLLFSPADLLLYGYGLDCLPPGGDASILPVILNSLIFGGLWWWLRHQCLTHADRLLGRGWRRIEGLQKVELSP